MQPTFRTTAARLRSDLRDHRVTPASFAAALEAVAPEDRDEWLDLVWDIDEIPPDDPTLPRGCVPYLPCAVATVLDALEQAAVTRDDVFVDVGCGAGRAALLAHLKTGAPCIGLEIQPPLVRTAQARADWLGLGRMRFLEGDAAAMIRYVPMGTVYFLYCPFGGERLRRLLDGLADIARTRPIRVCCIDMPLLEAPWLTRMAAASSRVDVYRSDAPDVARPSGGSAAYQDC